MDGTYEALLNIALLKLWEYFLPLALWELYFHIWCLLGNFVISILSVWWTEIRKKKSFKVVTAHCDRHLLIAIFLNYRVSHLELTKRNELSTVWPELIWIKVKKVLTSTTTASKYIPKRPRICINWNPPFQTSLHKIFKNCFLLSKSCFTMFTFRGTFTK